MEHSIYLFALLINYCITSNMKVLLKSNDMDQINMTFSKLYLSLEGSHIDIN